MLTPPNSLTMSAQHINPENPYVLNEYMYANLTKFDFDDSEFAFIHHFFSVLIPMLGISGACLVSYMAICHTPQQISSFSKMILLCAVVDIVFAVCDLWCMSVSLCRTSVEEVLETKSYF